MELVLWRATSFPERTQPTWLSTGGFWLYLVFCFRGYCGQGREEGDNEGELNEGSRKERRLSTVGKSATIALVGIDRTGMWKSQLEAKPSHVHTQSKVTGRAKEPATNSQGVAGAECGNFSTKLHSPHASYTLAEEEAPLICHSSNTCTH